MRNPDRISYLMNLILLIWNKQPDTRFNQLIHNLQWEYSGNTYKEDLWEKEEYQTVGVVAYRRKPVVDLFHVEDDKFIEFLEKKVQE